MYESGNKLRSGASALLTVIVLALIIGGAVVTFFMWPTPAPKVLISNVSPRPKNGERIEYDDPTKLYWEALYGKTGEELKATLYIGESPEELIEVASDIRGSVSSASEGIYIFSYDSRIVPHKQYWWKVKVENSKGKYEEGGPWSFQLKNKEPEKPVLTYPLDNEADVAIMNDTLRWNPAVDPDDDPVTYDVYFGRELNLPSSSLVASDLSGTSLPFDAFGKLDFATRYFWKVVARDDQGAEVSSRTQGFTTETIKDVPRPVKPQPGDGDEELNPVKSVLSWDLTTDRYYWPLEYDIYFSSDDQEPKIIATVSEPRLEIPDLQGHQEYQWYVVIRDTERNRQKKGDLWSFKTLNRNPLVRINILEEKDEEDGNREAILNWEASDLDGDRLFYNVYISKSGGLFEELAENVSATNYVVENLESAERYTIRVIAVDELGAEGFADLSFSSGNNSPVVNLLSPSDNSEIEPVGISLDWDGYDTDGDDVTYTVMISDESGYVNSTAAISGNSFEPQTLKSNTRYAWSVLAVDSKGASTTSASWSFRTLNNPPQLPVALRPLPEEVEVSPDQPTFKWTVDDTDNDSMTFVFMLSDNREFLEPLIYKTGVPDIRIPDTLDSNRRYYWKITASDGISTTEGPIWSFVTLNAEPQKPDLLFPLNGDEEVAIEGLKFVWRTFDKDDETLDSIIYLADQGGEPLIMELENKVGETTYVNQGTLKPSTLYTWWIVVRDSAGKEQKSSEYTFRTSNQPPIIGNIEPSGMFLNGLNLPVTFKWDVSDPEGEAVEVEVYLDPENKNLEELVPVASGPNLNSYKFSGPLGSGSDYTLTIKATDRGGKVTISNPIRLNIASDEIEYLQPLNGSVLGEDHEFKWLYKGKGVPDDYTFRLFDHSGKLIVLENLSSGQKNAYNYSGRLQSNMTYYWSVTVNDGTEKTGPMYSFRVPLPAVEFSNASPNGVDGIVPGKVMLSWNVQNVEGRDLSYDIYLGNSPVPLYSDIKTTEVNLAEELKTNTIYTWYVVARDQSGIVGRSTGWTFKTRNITPQIRQIQPTDGSKGLNGSIALTWQGVDPDSGILSYEIFVGDTIDGMTSIGKTRLNNFTYSDYIEGKKYYWMVRAFDENSTVDSSIWSFDTVTNTSKLSLVVPSNGQIGVAERPTLTWNYEGIDKPILYKVYLGNTKNDLMLIGEFEGNSALIPDTLTLNRGSEYYWKVVGIHSDGSELESPVIFFRVMDRDLDILSYIWNSSMNVAVFASPQEQPITLKASGSIESTVVPVVSNDKIYAISRFGSLYTFAVTGNELKEISRLQTGTAPETMKLVNGALWILDTKSAAAIVRIPLDGAGVPGEGQVVYKDWITPVDMAISPDGNTIIVADALSGIKILARSNTTFSEKSLTDDQKYVLEGYARTVQLVGNYVYVGEAGIDGGLNVIDLNNFTKTRVDGYYLAFQMAMKGNTLYVVTDKGLSIIDVTDPQEPEVIKNMDTSGSIRQLSAGKQILNIIGDRGPDYYDISDPEEPKELE